MLILIRANDFFLVFPPLRLPRSALWKAVQNFDIARFLLCHIEANNAQQKHWERVVAFFADRADSDDSGPPSMTKLITLFHEEHSSIGMARTSLCGFHTPTIKMMQHLRRKYKTQGTTDKELEALEK